MPSLNVPSWPSQADAATALESRRITRRWPTAGDRAARRRALLELNRALRRANA